MGWSGKKYTHCSRGINGGGGAMLDEVGFLLSQGGLILVYW